VDQVLDQLFSYGSTTLDRLAFQKALDDIGAVESAGAEFSLQVLSEHFERGVELLAQNELSPALPDEAFGIVQPQLAAAVAGEMESPSYIAGRALVGLLFPKKDPVQHEATPATIKSLTLQDLRNYYRSAFRPDLTTIVVMGKVNPAQAQAVVAKWFGDWKAAGPKPNTLFPPAPTNSPSTTHVPDASRVQDKVTLAQTLGITRTNPDYYTLELGDHVLGGAFYATRFYRDLRENNGLVYFVSSDFQVGLTRGVYSIDYACDPPNVAKARAIVVADLNDMRTKKVSSRELKQAQVLLLREIPLSESSVERVAKGWLSRSTLDLPLDEPIIAARRYVKLKAGDVREAFAKWVRPDNLVQVTQGPEPK
jgi:zinc protease